MRLETSLRRMARWMRQGCIVLFLCACQVWGQVDVNGMPGMPTVNPNNANQASLNLPPDSAKSADSTKMEGLSGIEYHIDVPDSVLQGAVFAFHRKAQQIKIMEFEHPQFTPTGAQFSDRLDALNGDYFLTVTELGHPHLSVFPSFVVQPGLVYRKNVFPGFYKTPDNVKFYHVKNPYTLLSYNSSLNKDYQLHVTHSQNIMERWNYALDYHLISPTGQFTNSSATDHIFDFNTNYYSSDARYQVSGGFIWQRMVLGENGGVSNDDTYVNKRISNMGGVPVMFNNLHSLTNDRTVFVKQSWNTVRQFVWYRPIKQKYIDTITEYDTIKTARFDVEKNDTVYSDSLKANIRYEVRDTIVGYDTIQPYEPHVYNTGVLALDMQWDKQKYRCGDSIMYHRLSASLYWSNDAYMDRRWRNPLKIYGGVRPEISWLRLEEDYNPAFIRRVALYPFGRVEFSPWAATELNVYAEAAVDMSEYNLDARLQFPMRDTLGNTLRNLTLRAVVQAHKPEFIYYAQTYHQEISASDDFKSVGVRMIEADFKQGDLLKVYASVQQVSHNIWFQQKGEDDKLIPHQTDSGALLMQLRVNLNLKVTSWLHYDMQQHVQYSSDQNQIRVPLFASKNSIYADFKLFNNALRTQIGFDIRYHTKFKADGYDPLLGVFFKQDKIEVGNYLWADFFINLQVKRASIYAKAGHFNSFLESHSYYLLPHYPANQFGFYFGLTWKFFD